MKTEVIKIDKRCPKCRCKISEATVIPDKRTTTVRVYCPKCKCDTVRTVHFIMTDKRVIFRAIDEMLKEHRRKLKERNEV